MHIKGPIEDVQVHVPEAAVTLRKVSEESGKDTFFQMLKVKMKRPSKV